MCLKGYNAGSVANSILVKNTLVVDLTKSPGKLAHTLMERFQRRYDHGKNQDDPLHAVSKRGIVYVRYFAFYLLVKNDRKRERK